MTKSQGLVFDFDGTIIDTETPVYESWAETYRFAGADPIPLEVWLQHIGKADDGSGLDVRAILCAQLGVDAISAQVEDHRRATRDEMLFAQPIRAGVMDWIEAAAQANVPLAVASSSGSNWVVPHLKRLGLDGYFSVVCCADPPTPGKPDPTVYKQACRGIQVAPEHAVAIEDSSHGVTAAISAGMRCIAAPGPITKTMDFAHATLHADSLADIDPSTFL